MVLEATYGWYWAADALGQAGAEVHLAHPLGVKAFGYRRVKNDIRDAADLADLLRAHRVEANIESLAETIPGEADPDETRREAIIALSAMVGALVMSRATAGSGISDEILDTVRNDFIDRYSPERHPASGHT